MVKQHVPIYYKSIRSKLKNTLFRSMSLSQIQCVLLYRSVTPEKNLPFHDLFAPEAEFVCFLLILPALRPECFVRTLLCTNTEESDVIKRNNWKFMLKLRIKEKKQII